MEEIEEEFYYVEKILSKQENPTRYLVKWEGWPQEQATWEPMENLENVMHLVEEFEAEFKKKSNFNQILKSKPNKMSKVEEKKETINEFDNWDYPEEVVTVKKNEGILYALVKFEQGCIGSDGMPKQNVWIPTKILADKSPNILIEFYESKIRFNT